MKHTIIQTNEKTIKLMIAFITLISALLAISVPINTSAAPQPVLGDRYIVVLHDSVEDTNSVAAEHARKHQAKVTTVYSHALKGYAATMSPGNAKALERDSRVAYVEIDAVATAVTTQSNAPWGLDRIDQLKLPLNTSFTYSATGSGVKAYIIDTGIRTSHLDFGGRAVDGFDAVDGSLPAADCNGHGTHVAGTVGGAEYGVAKDATLVSVRVLDCGGSGYWSWIIAGIDYVTANHQPGEPAVANLSLGGSASAAVDTAVKNSIADGVTYAIAAGNSSQDACRFSPARVSEAMTIGATDKNDSRPSWSNWGACVDWFAPGVNIKSAWYTNDSASNTISGTSMASPHAAGVAALYLQNNSDATPQQVRDALYSGTSKSVVKRAKSTNSHILFTNY